MRTVAGYWFGWVVAVTCVSGCGEDESTGTSGASGPFMPSATATATDGDSGTTTVGATEGEETSGETASGSTVTDATGDATGSTDPTDSTDPSNSTDPTGSDSSDPAEDCDPPMALFFGDPLAAAMELDFGAASCAARQGAVEGASLSFTVRPTGLIDVTTNGVSMQSSTHGTYINSGAVTGIVTDVAVTIELTDDGSGMPASVEFTFGSAGPMLTDVAVSF